MDKQLTDSLWAVASNRDREHKAPGHSGQERGMINKVQNEPVHLVEDEQRPVQNPRINTVEMKQPYNTIRAQGEASR